MPWNKKIKNDLIEKAIMQLKSYMSTSTEIYRKVYVGNSAVWSPLDSITFESILLHNDLMDDIQFCLTQVDIDLMEFILEAKWIEPELNPQDVREMDSEIFVLGYKLTIKLVQS